MEVILSRYGTYHGDRTDRVAIAWITQAHEREHRSGYSRCVGCPHQSYGMCYSMECEECGEITGLAYSIANVPDDASSWYIGDDEGREIVEYVLDGRLFKDAGRSWRL